MARHFSLAEIVGRMTTAEDDHYFAETPMTIFTDAEFAALIAERKQLPVNWRNRLKLLPRDGTSFLQRSFEIQGDGGHTFKVFMRKNLEWIEDFSIGLMLVAPDGEYVLTRYNGSSHKHTNHLEREAGNQEHSFRDRCHIHVSTERYQRRRGKEEGYAAATTAYASFETAIEAFFSANGFVKPPDAYTQPDLFAEEP